MVKDYEQLIRMLPALLRKSYFYCYAPRKWLIQSRTVQGPTTRQNVGISLIRNLDKQEEEKLFPALQDFNVSTENRKHTFNVPCDRVIKFIKLGAINKMIAVQYCHYIAHLSRISHEEDSEYYAKRCGDLMSYIIRNNKDVPQHLQVRLLCDVADTDKRNCLIVCAHILNEEILKNFHSPDFARLLGSCYKHGLWKQAQSVLNYNDELKTVNLHLIDPLVEGLIVAANTYKNLHEKPDERKEFRQDVIEHLFKVFEKCYLSRVQFVTKLKNEFIQSLHDLDINVTVSPTLKMTGRCTNCNSNLPLFNNRYVSVINSATRDLILKGSEKGLYLNSSPNDVGRFESFLQNIYASDKKPIDCVIDGLNIAYRNSVGVYFIKKQLTDDVQRSMKVRNPESQVQVLINTIIRGNMLNQFKKILVVGKWHMTKWPGLMDFFHKHKIHFYSSFNHSKDDLFQIFASTLSPKTVLVTADFFRDHLAQLQAQDRILLERWIDTHQVWIDYKTLKPIWPTPYEKIPSVDRDRNYFHVPIIDINQLLAAGEQDPPPHLNKKLLTWVCCGTYTPTSIGTNPTSASDMFSDEHVK